VPTRVVYALVTPITLVIAVGGMPAPTHAPPEVGFDEVLLKPTPTTALIAAILAAIRRGRSDSSREPAAA